MLPAEHRLRRREDFALTVRRGRRAATGTVVAHLHRPQPDAPGGARVGFVVSKAVGGAVVRNRVRRRLRHSMRDRLGRLPTGGLLVLRALPAASASSSVQLATDVDRALAQVTG